MIVKLLTEHHLEFLSLKGGCTGSSESTHVKIPHCWKSHVTAQLSSAPDKGSNAVLAAYANKRGAIIIPRRETSLYCADKLVLVAYAYKRGAFVNPRRETSLYLQTRFNSSADEILRKS